MADYTKLVADLRDKPRYKDKATLEIMDLCVLAADAIEALQAELRDYENFEAQLDDCLASRMRIVDLEAENERLKKQLEYMACEGGNADA